MIIRDNKKLNILVVEDNRADADLFCELMRGQINWDLAVVQDGEMAVNYITNQGPYNTASTPDLILLDLNLPKISGREVLRIVKRDERLKRIPVIVFTSSGAEKDILDCYNLNANCYIQKPTDVEKLDRLVQCLNLFWGEQVRLPPKEEKNENI